MLNIVKLFRWIDKNKFVRISINKNNKITKMKFFPS